MRTVAPFADYCYVSKLSANWLAQLFCIYTNLFLFIGHFVLCAKRGRFQSHAFFYFFIYIEGIVEKRIWLEKVTGHLVGLFIDEK